MWHVWGGGEVLAVFWWENLNERIYLEDLSVDGGNINFGLKKWLGGRGLDFCGSENLLVLWIRAFIDKLRNYWLFKNDASPYIIVFLIPSTLWVSFVVMNIAISLSLVNSQLGAQFILSIFIQGGTHSTLHTRQSSIQNNKYQVSQKHSCFSW